jgi:hypothetical protein
MSLAQVIKSTFAIVEPALENEAEKLLHLIFSSPDPRAALEQARRVLITDAANAAADLALRKILPPDPEPQK